MATTKINTSTQPPPALKPVFSFSLVNNSHGVAVKRPLFQIPLHQSSNGPSFQ